MASGSTIVVEPLIKDSRFEGLNPDIGTGEGEWQKSILKWPAMVAE